MSNFSVFNNTSTEKGDKNSKSGSGRVALFQISNLTHCYTVEAHYSRGRCLNSQFMASEKSDEKSNLTNK